jgi:hypothetical protein
MQEEFSSSIGAAKLTSAELNQESKKPVTNHQVGRHPGTYQMSQQPKSSVKKKIINLYIGNNPSVVTMT